MIRPTMEEDGLPTAVCIVHFTFQYNLWQSNLIKLQEFYQSFKPAIISYYMDTPYLWYNYWNSSFTFPFQKWGLRMIGIVHCYHQSHLHWSGALIQLNAWNYTVVHCSCRPQTLPLLLALVPFKIFPMTLRIPNGSALCKMKRPCPFNMFKYEIPGLQSSNPDLWFQQSHKKHLQKPCHS